MTIFDGVSDRPRYPRVATRWSEPRYQNRWRRIGAALLDSLLFLPVYAWTLILGVPIVSTLVFQSYITIFHWRSGQTFGKIATSVKVLDVSEDHTPGLAQSLLRTSVPAALGLLFYIGPLEGLLGGPALLLVVWCVNVADVGFFLFSDRARSLHDVVARTVVVRVQDDEANSRPPAEPPPPPGTTFH